MRDAFRQSVERAPLGIAHVAADGRFTYVNPRFCDIAGHDGETLLRQRFQDITVPDDLAEDQDRFDAVVGGRRDTYALDKRYRRADGKIVWIHLSVAAVRDEAGGLRYAVAAIEDITPRKKAETELAQSEQRLRVALQQAGVVVFNQDRDLRYTWIDNPRLGFAAADVLGRTDAELLGVEAAAPLEAFKREVLVSGCSDRRTFRLHRPDDGSEGIFDLVVEPMRDEAGHVTGLACAATDVTEAHARTEALRRAEERFRTSVESMRDAFGVYTAIRQDAGQIVDFRIEYVNAAACAANRMSRDAQIGRGLLEILPGQRESGLFDAYCALVATGVPLTREEEVHAADDEGRRLTRVFDISAARFEDGFVATWRDVTDRRQARAALHDALAQKDLLLHELEHRIANNLQLLASLLHLQVRGAEGEVAEALEKARRQVILMGSLHQQLRVGDDDVRHVRVDDYLRNICATLSSSQRLAERGIAIAVDAEPVTMLARDAMSFGLMVNEILTNALKYAFVGRDGGRVDVRLRPDEGEIRLVVADDGIGFDPAATAAGLGQRVVRQLARSLGGSIDIATGPTGTVVRVKLRAETTDDA